MFDSLKNMFKGSGDNSGGNVADGDVTNKCPKCSRALDSNGVCPNCGDSSMEVPKNNMTDEAPAVNKPSIQNAPGVPPAPSPNQPGSPGTATPEEPKPETPNPTPTPAPKPIPETPDTDTPATPNTPGSPTTPTTSEPMTMPKIDTPVENNGDGDNTPKQ
ncbi:MAG: hypothetical protein WDZ80_00100 [Candidatus Paceibacterota bacterium]